jgi:hypothetical protein
LGFYPQPNTWQCGPFALKHALAILGKFVDEKTLTKQARTTRGGTDERMLSRAAKAVKTKLVEFRRTNEDAAYRALTKNLEQGLPCLICINQWGHWVTIVGFNARENRFVVLDSEKDPVVRLPTWTELKRRWAYVEYLKSGERREYYDLYVVKPLFRLATKANFSLTRARYLRRPGNASLAKYFDEYVTDMLNIARPRSTRGDASPHISMAEFLRRHRKMLVETVSFWHGTITIAQLNRVLANMQYVAETYGLVVREEEEKLTIASFAALLMTWATSHDPVDGDIYGYE